ncbi:DUF3300 domain-containing protein [Chitinilyticum litopenaei]|uniref:DUF3300 domain-containing protein n=1 Tax=Chitinilyticum litopenaei TaxID=1121276 RepID=UPI00040BE0AC|nr:DUF3300 domain-containing protein [Chitinilyticum litopenaei]
MSKQLKLVLTATAILASPWLLPMAPVHAAEAAMAPAASFKQEEIEQLVAPVALYPDSLLAQVFMASTYPLEVVQAQRWRAANSKLSGKDLEQAVNQQPWDASVKSLTAFPQVLQMMNDKIDWTQKLGDAVLADQKRVMDAVQILRQRAQQAGNLKSSSEQQVSTQGQVIIIEPAQPETVYVPVYNPSYVYGPWPYPYYTPYYWYPPGYAYSGAIFGFTAGLIVGGAFWGWGNCNWGGGSIDIDINNNFTRVEHYKRNSDGRWQHNADHRRGVEYRDNATRDRYRNQSGTRPATRDANREAYRGKADSARQDLNRMSPEQRDAVNRDAGSRDGQRSSTGQTGNRTDKFDSAQNRAAGNAAARPSNDALRNVNSPGADRAASQRGNASRATPSRSSSNLQRPARSGSRR